MRILFMGTPDFAVASLKRLVADGHDICGVFTQPDAGTARISAVENEGRYGVGAGAVSCS